MTSGPRREGAVQLSQGNVDAPQPGDGTPALWGHVDAPQPGDPVDRRRVVVLGWHAWEREPALAVAVTVTAGRTTRTVVAAVGAVERPDVARATGVPALVGSGWRAVVDLGDEEEIDEHAEEDPAEDAAEVGALGRRRLATIEMTVWGTVGTMALQLPVVTVGLLPTTILGARTGADDSREPAPTSPSVFLDGPAADVLERTCVPLAGWALLGPALASTVRITVNGDDAGAARLGLVRSDVAARWSTPMAAVSGFENLLDLSAIRPATRWAHVTARASDPVSGLRATAERWFELADPTPAPPAAGLLPVEAGERRKQLVAAARAGCASVAGDRGAMNLAVFAHSLDYGGAQLWLTELLRQVGAGTRFGCTVIAQGSGPLRRELEAQGVEVHVTSDVNWGDRAAYDGRVTELALFLASRSHDAVLVNTALGLGGADAAIAVGLPVVWAIHESWRPPALWRALFGPAVVDEGVKRRFDEVVRCAGALVFVADATRRVYETATPPDRTVVVPYGIDVARIDGYCSRTTRAEARVALGVPAEARLLLMVGIIHPVKAQTLLAAAFAEVAGEYPDVHVVFVGGADTSYAGALRDLVAGVALDDRVRIVPVVDDTSAWYRAADVLLCCSDFESLPRTLLEAMCFGVPVAATRVFGIPELITDGVNGYLFDPCDRGALTGTLRRVLGEDPARLADVAQHGQATVRAGFDSSEYATDVMTLLEGLRADPAVLPAAILGRAGRDPGRRLGTWSVAPNLAPSDQGP